MFQKIVFHHILPLSIAFFSVFLIFSVLPEAKKYQKIITYTQEEVVPNGLFANFDNGVTSEMALMSSLKSPSQITLFGSSEFNSSARYFPFLFLKDSLHLNCLAFGHAHHQNLSILCELMASKTYLKNSKVTILLSPGWFEGEGTNPEAFLEFVRPNFLKRIIHDSLINEKYKYHLGKYIHTNSIYFEGMTKEMSYLRDLYLAEKGNFINRFFSKATLHIQSIHANRYYIPNVSYLLANEKKSIRKKWKTNIDSLLLEEQNNFLATVTNNLWVDQTYFETYLLEKDGSQKKGQVAEIDYLASPELEDFELLLQFLNENEVNASFVILPLNPYYYENLLVQKPLTDYLSQIISDAHYPLLNLSCYEKSNYRKGILKDVMHPGDYGWILINDFINTTYP